MKFKVGDATDSDHCIALQHEFLRCQDAFMEFEKSATTMILQGENRLLAYKTYNAYARFIHHLYEFLLAAKARDFGDTRKLQAEEAERYITGEVQRILSRTRKAIENGTAPSWENDISYYPQKVPEEFAREFREHRNKAFGHVTHQRVHLNLSNFYEKNHKYMCMLYRDCFAWWCLRGGEFPDLKEITDFSVVVRKAPQPALHTSPGQHV
jgi:hypothetical protein